MIALLPSLEANHLIIRTDTILDTTFMDAPHQRNTRDANATIKTGNILEEWQQEEQAAKLRQKDTISRWTKREPNWHFGTKSKPCKADIEIKLDS